DPQTVEQVKNPRAMATLCRRHGIPHPETSLQEPGDPAGWLVKRRGGAGGTHVSAAPRFEGGDRPIYFQRRTDGVPISALVLAAGGRAVVLGFSAQWSTP